MARDVRRPCAQRLGRRELCASLASLGVAGASFARSASADDEEEPRLSVRAPRLSLPAGRSVVLAEIPAGVFASVAVLGPPEASLAFDLAGSPLARAARRASPLDEDGLLPHVVSFGPRESAERFEVTVDVVDPVVLALVVASSDEARPPEPKALVRGEQAPRPLVGMPAPRSLRDGYVLQTASRYSFARIDVAMALLAAFDKTYRTFKRDPIAVSDISQWDGRRPKTDRSQPRHISHVGGADVDVGLPASDTFPSTTRDHCRGVLLDSEHFGCAPGSGKGVDYERLAFFLGTLCDDAPGSIVKVFMDDAYRRELFRVAPELRRADLIKDEALAALSEDGVVVASPWHTDHFHVRFRGEQGRPLF